MSGHAPEGGAVTLWQESVLQDPSSARGDARAGVDPYVLSGTVEIDVLRAAYDHVVRGHPALRSRHVESQHGWRQVAEEPGADTRVDELGDGGIRIGPAEFAHGVGRGLAITVVPVADGHQVSFIADFLFVDGTAMERVLEEVLDTYNALLDKRPPAPVGERVPPPEIARWQRSRVEADRSRLFENWATRLGGVSPPPLYHPPAQPGEGRETLRDLPGVDRQVFAMMARSRKVSSFGLVLHALALALAVDGGPSRLAVRSPFRGRMFSPSPDTVTTTANSLPIVCDVEQVRRGNRGSCQASMLQTLRAEHLPARFVEAELTDRGLLTTPFRALPFLVLNEHRQRHLGDAPLVPVTDRAVHVGHSPLSLLLDLHLDRAQLRCQYDASVVSNETASSLLEGVASAFGATA